jgi:hypothetical protein
MIPSDTQPNEDSEFDPEALAEAAQNLPTEAVPPEVDPATAALTEWDTAPSSSGKAAPKVLPEDEVPATEKLVGEGIDEADRELRIAAVDPDFEP